MGVERKKINFGFKRQQSQMTAARLVRLEKRFNGELNNITLPCGAKIKLASSISRAEKIRLMMLTKGFAEHIPVSSYEYAARMINAHMKKLRVKSYEL
jgi:hypothetical protein